MSHLLQYIKDDRADLLEEALLQGHEDVNTNISGGEYGTERTTLLIYATMINRIEIIEMLIRMGCDINAQDSDGQNALMHACKHGHLHLVQRFMELGSNIDHQDQIGRTALVHAARSGYGNILRLLLAAKGINADEVNQNEESIAEFNRLDNEGYSLLMNAFDCGNCNTRVLRLLLNIGCDVHQATEDGETALHLALLTNNEIEVIEMLIEHGSNVNALDNYNWSPLMHAFLDGIDDTGIINLLLDSEADVHPVNNHGSTLLMYAVKRHPERNTFVDADTIQRILDAGGVDIINRRDVNGYSALGWAVGVGNVGAVRMLLSVNTIRVSMMECRRAAGFTDEPPGEDDDEEVVECLNEVAAFMIQRHWRESHNNRVAAAIVIQRHWRECYWNPRYLVCYNRLMEEGAAIERDVERLRGGGSGSSGSGSSGSGSSGNDGSSGSGSSGSSN